MKLLPLGSILVLNKGVKKYMIVSRGLQVNMNGEQLYFDYAGVQYPEGMVGDELMYFQHEDINKVIFNGFADDDDQLMLEAIEKAVEELKPVRADVSKLKENN